MVAEGVYELKFEYSCSYIICCIVRIRTVEVDDGCNVFLDSVSVVPDAVRHTGCSVNLATRVRRAKTAWWHVGEWAQLLGHSPPEATAPRRAALTQGQRYGLFSSVWVLVSAWRGGKGVGGVTHQDYFLPNSKFYMY